MNSYSHFISPWLLPPNSNNYFIEVVNDTFAAKKKATFQTSFEWISQPHLPSWSTSFLLKCVSPWLLWDFYPLLLWPLLVSLFFGVFFPFLVSKSVFKCSTLRPVHLSLSTLTRVHGLGTIHISASQLGAILSISGNYSIVTTWGMCHRIQRSRMSVSIP